MIPTLILPKAQASLIGGPALSAPPRAASEREVKKKCDPAIMKPYVKPFVEGVAEDCAPYLAQMLSEGNLPVLQLRDEVDKLMEERLKELTADKVKALVEDILREHLEWLVVWGVIFGVLIGVICIVAGF